ncbi:MAG: NOP5/NOP56 family protein [Thermoplasmata archaeon]
MAYVRWHGIYAIKDGIVVDKIEFEKEKLPEYFQKLRNGEFDEFIKKYADHDEMLDIEEDMELLQRSLLEFGKLRIKEETLKEEGILQAISTLQDLDIYTNFLFEHLSEWYGVYTLKTDRSADETISNIMENVDTLIARTDYDKKALLSFSEFAKNAMVLKSQLENYVEATMDQVAPNLKIVAGPLIGALLIYHAGNLQKLANMPASKLQVLGAQTAMFRHLKKGAKPPKYGILFKHPAVHNAPASKRGKIARMLSGKILIAAKMDYYGNTNIGLALKDKINMHVDRILKTG